MRAFSVITLNLIALNLAGSHRSGDRCAIASDRFGVVRPV